MTKLEVLLEKVTEQSETFDLFVQGSTFEDRRRLIGYQLPGQRRQMFGFQQAFSFNVSEAEKALKAYKIDFAAQPEVTTFNNAKWKLSKTDKKPANLSFIRSKGIDKRAIAKS